MINVCVVGYGAIGRHHARNLREMPEANLVGIVDGSIGAQKAAMDAGYAVFTSLEQAIDMVDAVVVSVPTGLHREVAMKAICAGRSVLVEKPIAGNVTDGSDIILAARDAGVRLMVGYVERYNPAVVALRSFMKDGGLGKIHGISARRLGTMPARIKDANVIVDIGVHDIDMAAFVLDCALELKSAQGGRAILEDRVDFAFLALSGRGVPVHIEANWITPVKFREVFVTGENGLCHVDYVTQTAKFAAAREFSVSPTFEGLVEQYRTGEFVELPVKREEPLRRELRTFLTGVEGGPLPDPELSLVSLGIAEEATRMIESMEAREMSRV